MVANGPAWLGIGAQRSGTTWLTDLLVQHPQVALGSNGKKEQHLLHKVADGRLPAEVRANLCALVGHLGRPGVVPESRAQDLRAMQE